MTTDWRRFACSWTSRTSSRICLRCCSWSYGAAGGGGGWEQAVLLCLGVICPRVASSLEVSSLIATQMPFTDQRSCLINSSFDSDLDSGAADVLSWGFEATRQLEHKAHTTSSIVQKGLDKVIWQASAHCICMKPGFASITPNALVRPQILVTHSTVVPLVGIFGSTLLLDYMTLPLFSLFHITLSLHPSTPCRLSSPGVILVYHAVQHMRTQYSMQL